jgi:hypothetical protein
MSKIKNTLKMMGVSGKDALFFEDAYDCFPLTINPSVKKAMRDTMLNTVVMGKTFKEWFEHFVKEGTKIGVGLEYVNNAGLPTKRPYSMKDFNFDIMEKPTITLLLEMILQEFYKKENVLGTK